MVKIYKVGGCVRDKLLGQPSHDIDYVVVGATLDYMKNLGFIPVGRHFPVFLHPKTKEEYALARTEYKDGIGYHGFKFHTSPTISLEQDLARRDITINAIAEDDQGHFIDPFHGIEDLKNKIIRHVSPAFAEDPLRVLRVARFRATLNFTIAEETITLMKKISRSNELENLSQMRVCEEIKKSLKSTNPLEFFKVLNQVDALEYILKEFKYVVNNHALANKIEKDLYYALRQNLTKEEKFAIIICNIEYDRPNYTKSIIDSLDLGKIYMDIANSIKNNLSKILQLAKLDATDTLKLIKTLDPIRKTQRFNTLFKILSIVFAEKTFINTHLDFLNTTVQEFQQIQYDKLAHLDKSQLVRSINDEKLKIISHLHQQFYES